MKRQIFSRIAFLLCLCLSGLTSHVFAADGKKYALFIGINAYASKPLQGCVNDAKNLQRALSERFGFAPENTTLLLDEQATRDQILSQLQSYQTKARAGDVFVMTYSGHGTLFPDEKSEELDETEELSIPQINLPPGKYDSALCPIDVQSNTSGKPWKNLILDDELFNVFSAFTAKGAQVVFVSDSCHSGTLARAFGGQTLSMPAQGEAFARFLPPAKIQNLNQIARPARSQPVRRRNDAANNLLIVLTGSKDTEFSNDYRNEQTGEFNGLFTLVLLRAIKFVGEKGQKLSYLNVQQLVSPAVNEMSIEKYNRTQTPQIDARFFKGDLDAPLFEFAGKPIAALGDQVANPAINTATNQTNTTTNQANATSTQPANSLRVVVKVTDKLGNPIEGAAVGIFNLSARKLLTGAGNVQKIPSRDIRAAGRTDAKGLYDSKSQSLYVPLGTHLIKVIRDGYQPYIGDVSVVENAEGFCVLIVKLDK